MNNLILPNPKSTATIAANVHQKLFRSLHHLVFEVIGQRVTPPLSEDALRAIIFGGPSGPSAAVFALHAALLDAATRSDMAEVPKLFEVLSAMADRDTAAPTKIAISPLSETHVHHDDVDLLKRVFADDIGLTANLVGPPEEEVARAQRLICEAVDALDQAAPAWAEELRSLANHIYLATAHDEASYLFAGAAVFDAFGAMLINPVGLRDRATTMMAVIHESSHQQMFLFHLDDPVVLNDAEFTYTSPLRKEPRPMEGIFHAMWVSARMVLAARAVRLSPHAPEWADDLKEHQTRAHGAFSDCVGTVAEHADLSELGATLFACAQDAVDGA